MKENLNEQVCDKMFWDTNKNIYKPRLFSIYEEKRKMISKKVKKAQGEIITTILIILLVLAAVIIVWQVIKGTVERGAKAVGDSEQCFTINLEIKTLTASSSITLGEIEVRRAPGIGELKKFAVVVDGNKVKDEDAVDLEELGTKKISDVALAVGNEVEIYAIVGESDHLCEVAEDKEVVKA